MSVGILINNARSGKESGFSLTELLVTILVLSIVAAIAVPVFLKHRSSGWNAQAQAAAKNAASAVQSYATGQAGSFSGLDAKSGTSPEMVQQGYRPTTGVTISVKASATAFCVTADHAQLSGDWKYASAKGRTESGGCLTANG